MPLPKFFKKPLQRYAANNRLEEVFFEAAKDPAARPEFYRMLHHFGLFVLGTRDPDDTTGRSLSFRTSTGRDGTEYVWAYTSLEALQWTIKSQEWSETPYVAIPATALFQALGGRFGLYLNPNMSVTKEFSSAEINSHVSSQALERIEVPANTEMYLGQPSQDPVELKNAFVGYMKREPMIEDIYFGLRSSPQGESALIAYLDFGDRSPRETDLERVQRDIGILRRETSGPVLPLDIAVVQGSEPRRLVEQGALLSLVQWSASR